MSILGWVRPTGSQESNSFESDILIRPVRDETVTLVEHCWRHAPNMKKRACATEAAEADVEQVVSPRPRQQERARRPVITVDVLR